MLRLLCWAIATLPLLTAATPARADDCCPQSLPFRPALKLAVSAAGPVLHTPCEGCPREHPGNANSCTGCKGCCFNVQALPVSDAMVVQRLSASRLPTNNPPPFTSTSQHPPDRPPQ